MPSTREEALQQQQQELDAIMKSTRTAFQGAYAEQLNGLLGLSKEDLDAITPNVSNATEYAQLIEVVKQASAKNLSNAELKSRIEALGSTAVSIAKSVGSLAALLA
jgi:predicted phage gp36 major capsid-like protein